MKDYKDLFYIDEDTHTLRCKNKLSPADKWDALEMSIAKWEFIVENPDIHGGGSGTCGLCSISYTDDSICMECPVMEKTGKRLCIGTPYGLTIRGDKKAAQAELDFLRSLRPVKEAQMDDYKNLFYVEDRRLFSREPLEPKSELEALLMSIEAWRIRVENPGTLTSVSSCGLCKYYSGCNDCILDVEGEICGGENGAYVKYYDNPTSENAQVMLNTLISLCPEWLKALLGESEEDAPEVVDYGVDWHTQDRGGGETNIMAKSKKGGLYYVGHVVLTGHYPSESAKNSAEMAERIALCMNACANISNDDLGHGVQAIDHLVPIESPRSAKPFPLTSINLNKREQPTVQDVCDLLEKIEQNGIHYPRVIFYADGSGKYRTGLSEDTIFSFLDTADMMRKLAEYCGGQKCLA